MPERSALTSQLRELDQTLAERGMPAAARARVEARLHRETVRRATISGFRLRWLPALTFVAGAALVLMVVGLRWFERTGSPPVEPPAETVASRVMGMFTVQGEGCRHRQELGDTVLDGTCRLVAPSMALHTWDRVRLHGEQGTVQLREGTAMFDVTEVDPGAAPTRIRVSHGTIEVLGTRFTIEQGLRGGYVDLFEGRIRFVGLDGSSTEIAPGQRYTWGETIAALTLTPPPVAAPAAAGSGSPTEVTEATGSALDGSGSAPPRAAPRPALTSETTPPSTPRRSGRRSASRRATAATSPVPLGSPEEATAIIEEVARLRAERQYTEAAAVLRRADRARRWDRRTAPALSYARGDILEHHLGDDPTACEHWARHQARFSGGRYTRAVSAARLRLGCPPTAR